MVGGGDTSAICHSLPTEAGSPRQKAMNNIIGNILKKHQPGVVIVYTDNGKGKTTAALGQALRAYGHAKKVLILQFMKGKETGEEICIRNFLPGIEIQQCAENAFLIGANPSDAAIKDAAIGIAKAGEAAQGGDYDMVILDEANVGMELGLIPVESIIKIIKRKHHNTDIILTGRYAPQEIIALADTVSVFDEVKHHYAKGITERAGIEY